MKLAKPLYNADGMILLNAGIELQDRFIDRLKELDVSYIYVEDDLTQDIDVPDVIGEKTRVEAVSSAKKIVEQIKLGRGVDAAQAKKVTNTLVDELCRNKGVMANFSDMRTRNDYLFSHSVNVCVLSIMTGISLGFDELRLQDLGVGALLHDVGKIEINPDILNKNGRLTVEEAEEIKKHPSLGFNLLRSNPDISLISAHCAFQHHERYDGSGYPRGLKEDQIHQYAQIVSIADVYDALTSDATYRRAMPVYEAIAIITKAGGSYFDSELVKAFVDNIAIYPIGSVVRLNNNQIGVVVDISREFKSRPVVRILFDEHKQPVTKLIELDLSKNPRLYIADVVER
jgi:HD-GYP domain-containing protein (c-di-GMP phosphodiesterase class II)